MAKVATKIKFRASVHRPGGKDASESWTFVRLPQESSDQLPSRSMVSVEGTFNGTAFQATLQPDGEGGHWLKIDDKLAKVISPVPGQEAELAIAPAAVEPEPEVPEDVRQALEAAGWKAMETWKSITPMARRDYVAWIVSGKKAETRTKRIEVACSKLAAGNRRPCCFDRSGKFDKSLSCPIPADD